MKDKFFQDFDNIFEQLRNFINTYQKSIILQNYCFNIFKSFIYGNIINNFFSNLKQENIKEFKLPEGKIGLIKKKYEIILRDVNNSLSLFSSKHGRTIDENYYKEFKEKVNQDFPEFTRIILEIEKKFDMRKVKDYLGQKQEEIEKCGDITSSLSNSSLLTKILEVFIEKQGYLPKGNKLSKLVKPMVKKCAPGITKIILNTLNENKAEMLKEQRKIIMEFEKRLYFRWKEPLDILECMIRVSLEAIEKHRTNLIKKLGKSDNFKITALLNIHARAIQISKEIIVLLKSGYADGANARWRSLHELAIISIFLRANCDDVSKRYLEHDIVKRYKEAIDYRTYCKKLGYAPLERKVFNRIAKGATNLCKKYSDRFQDEYGWIPVTILRDRKFRSLEKHVKFDTLRPYYNLACNAVHGGARGFYRLGVMDYYQNKGFLVGPSNYGLADPLQNSALSLLHITICLLSMASEFENIIIMQVLNTYVNQISNKAVKVQKAIEKEEQKRRLFQEKFK